MGLIKEFENHYWQQNRLVCGLDEAGRGPMAGPVVVCGVIFPAGFDADVIDDSKKLSAKKRAEVVGLIKEQALWYEIEIVDMAMIDTYNIYRATQMAMERIASHVPKAMILTDAMPLTGAIDHESIIKGDARSLSIAAASILAKTTRDAIMDAYDVIYPEYGFKSHKGYGTRKHKEAIVKYGRSPIHRQSFKFKDE